MQTQFNVNGIKWCVLAVPSSDTRLMRSDGVYTLGVTDLKLHMVFISDVLKGSLLTKVICHELCHVFALSYNYYMDIQTEEIVADFLSLYGREVFKVADEILSHFMLKTDVLYGNI